MKKSQLNAMFKNVKNVNSIEKCGGAHLSKAAKNAHKVFRANRRDSLKRQAIEL